jgi:HPt (histidine-containing phosphotransfer) domain-containing protein
MTPDPAPLPPTWTSPVLAGVVVVLSVLIAVGNSDPNLMFLLVFPLISVSNRLGWRSGYRASSTHGVPDGAPSMVEAPAAAHLALASAAADPDASRQWVDEVAVLDRMGGSMDILMELTELFADENVRRLVDLRAALAAGDALQVSREAHGIKSGLTNFCADDAVDIAFYIEKTSKEGVIDGLSVAIDRLESALAEVTEQLTAMGRAA